MGIMHSVLTIYGHQAHFEFISARWGNVLIVDEIVRICVFDFRSSSQKTISHLFRECQNEGKLVSRCVVFLYNLLELVLETTSIALLTYSLVTRGAL